jgi:urea transport system permease protein
MLTRRISKLKPNSGVRGGDRFALVQFQLSDPDPATPPAGADALERDAEASHLSVLRAASRRKPIRPSRHAKERLSGS